MKITVRNIKNESIRRKELVYACNWIGDMIMGRKLCKNIHVSIQFADISEYGLSSPAYEDYHPREFEIFIRHEMSRLAIIETTAHELVHVKQFARRELRDYDTRNKPKYLGKVVSTTDLHYYDYPWEIEAFGRAVGLYNRYIEHLDDNPKLKQKLL